MGNLLFPPRDNYLPICSKMEVAPSGREVTIQSSPARARSPRGDVATLSGDRGAAPGDTRGEQRLDPPPPTHLGGKPRGPPEEPERGHAWGRPSGKPVHGRRGSGRKRGSPPVKVLRNPSSQPPELAVRSAALAFISVSFLHLSGNILFALERLHTPPPPSPPRPLPHKPTIVYPHEWGEL